MNHIDTMKLALEALEHVIYWDNEKPEWEYAHAAITALREALASEAIEQPAKDEFKAAYIEAMVASNEAGFAGMSAAETIRELSRMVAEQPAQQEPVADRENAIIRFALHQFMSNAYLHMNAAAQDKDSRHYTVGAVEKFAKDAKDAEALLSRLQFKAPQPAQRKPLTDEEIILIVADCASSHQHTDIHFARAIERAHGIKELV